MNRLSKEKRERIVSTLVEGRSTRATSRMLRVSKNTVLKLLVDIGRVCAEYHHEHVRGLKPDRVQCDEIWSFCYVKEKNLPYELRGQYGHGDVWTWTALDSDTKLIVSYYIGQRRAVDAREFMLDLAARITNLTQLTTDGFMAYPDAVYDASGTEVDYAMLAKEYQAERVGEARYSPPRCAGATKRHIIGRPEPAAICTSHVERQNLTTRMSMRRFTRLTDAFSRKVENLEYAIALHFMHYSFCRNHPTLGTTPAVAAGLADHAWTLAELVGLLEAEESSN